MTLPMKVDGVTVNNRKEMMELAETNANAQFILCEAFYYGNGVPKDYKKSLYYGLKAAEQNNSQACLNVSWLYQKGMGCEVDLLKAEQYALKAEKLGDEEAYSTLAEMYLYGMGPIRQNIVKGIDYLYKGSKSKNHNTAEEFGITDEQAEQLYQNIVVHNSFSQKEILEMAKMFRNMRPEEYNKYEPEGMYSDDDYSDYGFSQENRLSVEAMSSFLTHLTDDAEKLGIKNVFPYMASKKFDKEFETITENLSDWWEYDSRGLFFMLTGTSTGIREAMHEEQITDLMALDAGGIIVFDEENDDNWWGISYDDFKKMYLDEDDWLCISDKDDEEYLLFSIDANKKAVKQICKEITAFIHKNYV